MKMPLKWEFPGGKIDPGENPEACLRRELIEEMNLEVTIKETLRPATHSYPEITVTLYPFICSIASGDPQLNEHAAVTWLAPEQLRDLDWAEADLPVLASYLSHIGHSGFCLSGKL